VIILNDFDEENEVREETTANVEASSSTAAKSSTPASSTADAYEDRGKCKMIIVMILPRPRYWKSSGRRDEVGSP
jgi:hypothetical protein